MTQPSVYLETTIISYLAAWPSRDPLIAVHQEITHQWWTRNRPLVDVYVSELVWTEAARGDATAAAKRLELLKDLPTLEVTNPARELAELLVKRGPIPAEFADDAAHIASATVHGLNFLLTWNCRHIANAWMREAVSMLCREAGYEPPTICTPEELMEYHHVGRPDRG